MGLPRSRYHAGDPRATGFHQPAFPNRQARFFPCQRHAVCLREDPPSTRPAIGKHARESTQDKHIQPSPLTSPPGVTI